MVNSSSFDFAEKKFGYFNSIGKSLMIKKIIFTDSPELFATKKSYEKLIITKDPTGFIKIIDSLL